MYLFSFPSIQELFREFAVQSQALRTEQDMHRKQTELEDRLKSKMEEAQRDREMETRKVILTDR